MRESALKIAGYFGYPACLDRVLACCRNATEAVRRTAVEQLPLFDDSRASDLLLQALDDATPINLGATLFAPRFPRIY